eukprot:scaffold275745_cov16-Tisochrysis_lutea.AAC.1
MILYLLHGQHNRLHFKWRCICLAQLLCSCCTSSGSCTSSLTHEGRPLQLIGVQGGLRRFACTSIHTQPGRLPARTLVQYTTSHNTAMQQQQQPSCAASEASPVALVQSSAADLDIAVTSLHKGNLEALKLMNSIIFPLKYSDQVYRDCMQFPQLTALGEVSHHAYLPKDICVKVTLMRGHAYEEQQRALRPTEEGLYPRRLTASLTLSTGGDFAGRPSHDWPYGGTGFSAYTCSFVQLVVRACVQSFCDTPCVSTLGPLGRAAKGFLFQVLDREGRTKPPISASLSVPGTSHPNAWKGTR